MAYLLNDGKGQEVAIYSSCSDITYAQAELLLLTEKLKKENPEFRIVGELDQSKTFGVRSFLEAYASTPEDLKKLQDYQAEIKAKGFVAKAYNGDYGKLLDRNPKVQMGRCVSAIGQALSAAADIIRNGKDPNEALDDIFANPLHAGVHIQFPATVTDDLWVADAIHTMRRTSQEKWLRRMLSSLRSYFKGTPKVAPPNKLDKCVCGSGKKYGRCCGYAVEPEDPEECKLGCHDYTSWKLMGEKAIRTCERCYRLQEAPWFLAKTIAGIEVKLVGCVGCSSTPTDEQVEEEIKSARSWNVCPICAEGYTLTSIIIEHEWSKGKHTDKWITSEVVYKEATIDITSDLLSKRAFAHKTCFKKMLPKWDEIAKEIPKKSGDIAVEIEKPST